MDAKPMYEYLFDQYQDIRSQWTEALHDLAGNLYDRDQTRRDLEQTRESVNVYQRAVILGETHKEGRINGSNAETRKHQTDLLLAGLPNEDPDFKEMTEALLTIQLHLEELDRTITGLRDKISFLRNSARMVSGLAQALAA